MVSVGIRGLIVVLMVLGGICSVCGEGPELIGEKKIETIVKKGGVYNPPHKNPTYCGKVQGCSIDCTISKLAVSEDGKFIGYKVGGECASKYIIFENLGIETIVTGNYYTFHGFIWDNDKIVAIESPTTLSRNIIFFNSSGEKIKEINLNANNSFTNFDISPSGKYMMFIESHKKILIFDREGNHLSTAQYSGIGKIISSAISDEGDVAIFSALKSQNKGEIILFNRDGEQIFKNEIEFYLGSLRISPDGLRTGVIVYDQFETEYKLILINNLGNILFEKELKNKDNGLEIRYDRGYLIFTSSGSIFIEDGTLIRDFGKNANSFSTSKSGGFIIFYQDGKIYHFNSKTGENFSINQTSLKVHLSEGGLLWGYTNGSYFIYNKNLESNISLNNQDQNFQRFTDEGNFVSIDDSNPMIRYIYHYNTDGDEVKNFKLMADSSLTNFVVSHNGEYLTFVDKGKEIKIFDGEGNLLSIGKYEGLGRIISSSISNNGDVAIFSSDESNGKGFLVYYENGKQIFNKKVEISEAVVKISPDGGRIGIKGLGNKKFNPDLFTGIILFENRGKELWRLNETLGTPEIRKIRGDYHVFAEQSGSTSIIKEGEVVSSVNGGSFSVSENGNYIVTTSEGKIYLYDNSERTKATSKNKIVILANSLDYELNSDLFGFLENNGMNVIRATADDFDQYKNENFVVILGGPDAPEGVGEIVREILMNSEQNQIRDKGNRKMYVKTNVWSQGQRVSVIAGSDRAGTKNAAVENKGKVAEE